MLPLILMLLTLRVPSAVTDPLDRLNPEIPARSLTWVTFKTEIE